MLQASNRQARQLETDCCLCWKLQSKMHTCHFRIFFVKVSVPGVAHLFQPGVLELGEPVLALSQGIFQPTKCHEAKIQLFPKRSTVANLWPLGKGFMSNWVMLDKGPASSTDGLGCNLNKGASRLQTLREEAVIHSENVCSVFQGTECGLLWRNLMSKGLMCVLHHCLETGFCLLEGID